MTSRITNAISRRRFLKTAGATALAASGPAIIIPGRAQQKTLKILDVKGTDPAGYDEWLPRYVQEWGERNDTRVILDRLISSTLASRVTAEAAEQRGHDLVNFYASMDLYFDADPVIDLRDVQEECERRFGKPVDISIKQSYNAKVRKFHKLIPDYLIWPVVYRRDLWDAAEKFPETWEDVRLGGRKIKFLYGPAVGLSLGSDADAWRNVTAILFSFGGSLQDADNRPTLKSRQTLEALKFFKALYEEAMTDDMVSWDGVTNNRAMLAEEISFTLNPVNITRTAENLHLPVAAKLALAKPPQGPARRLGLSATGRHMGIWKFAKNIDGAKRFLVDLVGSSRQSFLASQFYHFPAYPQAVPDIAQLLAADASAQPPGKYRILTDVADCTTYLEYPGDVNVAAAEVVHTALLQKMFASAATGKMSPEEALTQADQEVRRIYRKWQDLGKI